MDVDRRAIRDAMKCEATLIGAIGGLLCYGSLVFLEQVLKIDDPVGAISVHGVCGALGTLLVGVFATDGGLLYGGGFSQLGIQANVDRRHFVSFEIAKSLEKILHI
mgnify:CR=1 FL=1